MTTWAPEAFLDKRARILQAFPDIPFALRQCHCGVPRGIKVVPDWEWRQALQN
jgi:hypothetical protein